MLCRCFPQDNWEEMLGGGYPLLCDPIDAAFTIYSHELWYYQTTSIEDYCAEPFLQHNWCSVTSQVSPRCRYLCPSQLKCGFTFRMFQLNMYGKRWSIIHRSVRATGKLLWVSISRCVIIYVCLQQFLQAFHYSTPEAEARGLSLNCVGTTRIQNVGKNGRKLLVTGFKSRRWNAIRASRLMDLLPHPASSSAT